ncbi:hypothetical protein [Devosia sp. 1566]|uniref:ImmA/IrrE family metallo-endopeptidase n=1 Tax=Devosia sp. 1566 TaxID=2499144 RepID=UPI000FD93159|nr:hypothetical protein [Devosia sp. 1566]
MVGQIALKYPHDARSLEPGRLRRSDIAALALEVREQLVPDRTPKLDVTRIIHATRQLRVNGLEYDAHWELRKDLQGEFGEPALGLVDFDKELPKTALVFLDEFEVHNRDYIARSTAAHELAHLLFDAPARLRKIERGETLSPVQKADLMLPKDRSGRSEPMNWVEWRADEFMGSLLAPAKVIHAHMLRVCIALRVPRRANEQGRLMINGNKAGNDLIQAVIDELAEIFGLSSVFIEYRLQRYGFVHGERNRFHA